MTRSRDTADQINRINSSAANATAITVDSSENVTLTGALDVTGTATMDGFASNAASSITVSSASITPDADANNLVIQENGAAGITIGSATASVGSIRFADSGNARSGMIYYNHSGDHMRFYTGANERVRIESTGTVLVGTTESSPWDGTTSGIALRHEGFISAASTGSPAELNRLGSDGNIINLRKDGSTVASIGVLNSNNLTISGTVADHGGLQFGTHAVLPMEANADSNGTVDLGASGSRFKDAYLSGGVYLGGTGSANKLSDFETGTWTPVDRHGAVSFTVYVAYYTKIGRVVNFECGLQLATNSSSNDFQIAGLPFTVKNGADDSGGAGAPVGTNSGRTDLFLCSRNQVFVGCSTNQNVSVAISAYSGKQLKLNGWYITDS